MQVVLCHGRKMLVVFVSWLFLGYFTQGDDTLLCIDFTQSVVFAEVYTLYYYTVKPLTGLWAVSSWDIVQSNQNRLLFLCFFCVISSALRVSVCFCCVGLSFFIIVLNDWLRRMSPRMTYFVSGGTLVGQWIPRRCPLILSSELHGWQTSRHTFNGLFSRTTWVSRHQIG